MRIAKISALALLLSVPLGSTLASAADLYVAPAKHTCWLFQHHEHHHHILDFLASLCHHPKG